MEPTDVAPAPASATEAWDHITYLERAQRLVARGVDVGLAHELRWAGNPSLIIEAERATDGEIAELNAAHRRRAERKS